MSILNNKIEKKGVHIYVINLDSATERMDNMDRQLHELELPYQRVSAIDGNKLTSGQLQYCLYKKLDTHGSKRYLTKGEIGCYLSHTSVLERIKREKNALSLILEDDVLLTPLLPKFLNNINNITRHWDVINLSGEFSWLEPSARMETLETQTIFDNCKLAIYQSNHAVKAHGTSAYLVSFQSCCQLLERIYPIQTTSDDFLNSPSRNGFEAIFGTSIPIITLDKKYSQGSSRTINFGTRSHKLKSRNKFINYLLNIHRVLNRVLKLKR